jgi:hypothetical protein
MNTTAPRINILDEIDANELFARPMGPTDDCLSASQIVRMFESGARPEELRHLLACQICKDLYVRSNQIERMLAIDSSASAAEKFGQKLKNTFFGQTKNPQPHLLAVVGLSEPELEVMDLEAHVSLTIDLLPVSSSTAASIDMSTLKLNGAVISDSPILRSNDRESGQSDQLATVTFERGKLSKDVKRTLAEHIKVADQVQVTGALKGGNEDLLLAQAKVRFVRSQKLEK